ncbi:hypothetical protein C7S18_10725 [Ahniella affigens]|uniref:Uncharacterized protein n=1 Tax=Ahniella affigens TaxID=2021234 RepID=A0A2P1PS09_9GAMM|nr:hypothetical protein C7S18_10725 [Ahniella affigens]
MVATHPDSCEFSAAFERSVSGSVDDFGSNWTLFWSRAMHASRVFRCADRALCQKSWRSKVMAERAFTSPEVMVSSH